MSAPSDDDRFIAYVPYQSPRPCDFASFTTALNTLFPAMAGEARPLALSGIEDSGFAIVLSGVPITIIAVPAQLPATEWQRGAQSNIAWPGAAEAITACGYHLIVAPLAEVDGYRDAQTKSAVTTIAAACAAHMVAAVAVVWVPAFSVTAANEFEKMARAFVSPSGATTLPLGSWLRLEFGKMDGHYAALARGLHPFVGHDLGVLSQVPDPHAQATILYDVGAYLIQNGAVIVDGDTMDIGPAKMRARRSPDKQMLWLEEVG